jgi:hypothetical protein
MAYSGASDPTVHSARRLPKAEVSEKGWRMGERA